MQPLPHRTAWADGGLKIILPCGVLPETCSGPGPQPPVTMRIGLWGLSLLLHFRCQRILQALWSSHPCPEQGTDSGALRAWLARQNC